MSCHAGKCMGPPAVFCCPPFFSTVARLPFFSSLEHIFRQSSDISALLEVNPACIYRSLSNKGTKASGP